MPNKSFYVTTPIYYVNDAPHIGHAYTSVAGDVITRWHRQHGESVMYLTGTDEHGTKVQSKAEANSMAPQDWVDKLVAEHWQPVLETLNVANDDFIRTTQKRHQRGVRKFWEILKERGFVYQADYQGPYCVACEEFKLPGDLLEGDADELICKVHGKPVQLLNEKNWFFRLQDFQDRLIEHYERNPEAIAPASAYNEVLAFIRGGLSDVSMSRESVDWGIALPWDRDQVVYVWFDALLNYITAIGYGDPQAEVSFDEIWPTNIHLVGKDILRFHAVFWPAMLMAADLPLPKQVFAHGWLLVGGEKMSKTKLTGIAPNQITSVWMHSVTISWPRSTSVLMARSRGRTCTIVTTLILPTAWVIWHPGHSQWSLSISRERYLHPGLTRTLTSRCRTNLWRPWPTPTRPC
jgi:methionyl-tRNA synthetase